jgi:uncharacterized membrane protein YphA (DoxX/SURF4 family)
MNRLPTTALVVARALVALVFLLNAFGIIDQNVAIHELIERGVPEAVAPTLMAFARTLEAVAGTGLALGIFPQLSSVGLIAFLIPATVVGHPFWIAGSAPVFMSQLVNFSKNLAILGGLLFIASIEKQPGPFGAGAQSARLRQAQRSKL